MPSVKEIYSKISDVTIDADTINLNTDTVESLLSTVQTDIALIKANGVSVNGTVTANTGLTPLTDTQLRATAVPISGTVTAVNHQGTTVTTSNFTSTTPSTVLASFNAGREVLTIFNEGAGNLHISAGATCTTIAYQVRLSAGDYYEVPLNQTSLTHSAVFATAGTARVTEVS
jgi:hypothetical protein